MEETGDFYQEMTVFELKDVIIGDTIAAFNLDLSFYAQEL